jgi:hypothetical protein
VTISPIRAIERRQVHIPDRVNHEPRQMIRGQPIPHVRRQQKSLLTMTLNEVLRHPGIVLNVPDRNRLCDSLDEYEQSASAIRRLVIAASPTRS